MAKTECSSTGSLAEIQFHTAIEALVDRVVFAKALQEIFPRSIGVNDPNHCVEKAAIVFGITAGVAWFFGKQRLEATAFFTD